MQVLLQRLDSNDKGTVSVLLVNGELFAFVPEDPHQKFKIPGKTRIPAGKYLLTLEFSPKFTPKYGHKMMTVNGVPGFTGIRIHRGTSPDDTEGCILPNMQCILGAVPVFGLSQIAYDRLYKEVGEFLANGGEAWLTVRDESFLWDTFSPSPVKPQSVA